MVIVVVEAREQITYNNDPQRRCYDGCHASTATYWTNWLPWSFGQDGPFESLQKAEEYVKWRRDFFTNKVMEFRVVEEA